MYTDIKTHDHVPPTLLDSMTIDKDHELTGTAAFATMLGCLYEKIKVTFTTYVYRPESK